MPNDQKTRRSTIKPREPPAAGRRKSHRSNTFQYTLWIGASVGIVVVACVVLIVSPDRKPHQIPVNDPTVISHANRNAKSWQAGKVSFFDGWTMGDVKALSGISVSPSGGAVAPCQLAETPVPGSFDAREKWPTCFKNPIYNMGNCTASWAVATASSLSNRFCIASPAEYGELMLSPQQLLSCDTTNRGCSGGDVDTAWIFMEKEGLVTEQCFPYQGDSSVGCGSRCSGEAPFRAASHCVVNNEAAIRREIFSNGPVVAPLFLVDDFLVYKGGLYQEMPTATQLADYRRQRIIHAVKIIGWGKMQGRNYWLIENSWGDDWGEGGYAKVVAGGDPEKREGIVIETYVLAGTPSSKKVDDILGDIDSDEFDMEEFDADFDKASGGARGRGADYRDEDDDEIL